MRLRIPDIVRLEVDEENRRVCIVRGLLLKERVICFVAPSGVDEEIRAAWFSFHLAILSKSTKSVNRLYKVTLFGTSLYTILWLLGIVPIPPELFVVFVALWLSLIIAIL